MRPIRATWLALVSVGLLLVIVSIALGVWSLSMVNWTQSTVTADVPVTDPGDINLFSRYRGLWQQCVASENACKLLEACSESRRIRAPWLSQPAGLEGSGWKVKRTGKMGV
ncbi:unnamed protein product [Protopolystoma xenopodis]|uniref:Uncharacterized protein n=1 Tax=Protopolystoma xenopodis TaxID=117903 RepID=A0A3S5A1G0_9PLAT|nr:unnamed protein product [Protopolystoma xenopodis]